MHLYDIGGLVRLAVGSSSVEGAFLDHWLEAFAVVSLEPAHVEWFPDLELASPSPQAVPVPGDRFEPPSEAYVEIGSDGRWVCYGPDHNLVPLLAQRLLDLDCLLVFAAAVEIDGVGTLVHGDAGAGKTVVFLAAATDPGVRALSDEAAIVAAGGRLLAFPTPVALHPRHFPLLGGEPPAAVLSRASQRRLVEAALRLPGGRTMGRALKRHLVRRGGRLADFATGVHGIGVDVSPAELLQPSQLIPSSRTGGVVRLQRGDRWKNEMVGPEAAAAALLADSYAEGDLHHDLLRYARAGVIDLPAHWGRAGSLARRLVEDCVRLHVTVPADAAVEEVQAFVTEAVRTAVGATGRAESGPPAECGPARGALH